MTLTTLPATVAVEVTVASARVSVLLLDLYVESLSDHVPGQSVLKVREVAAW